MVNKKKKLHKHNAHEIIRWVLFCTMLKVALKRYNSKFCKRLNIAGYFI